LPSRVCLVDMEALGISNARAAFQEFELVTEHLNRTYRKYVPA
jgi:hypothetical protein